MCSVIVPEYVGLLARPMIDCATEDSSICSCSNGCRVLDGMNALWRGMVLMGRACESLPMRCGLIGFCAIGLFALGHGSVFTKHVLLDAVGKLAYKLAWAFENGSFNACT